MATGKVDTYEEFLAKHSAGLRAIGFDEQFACFVNHLLDLRADEAISYENEDDIAIKRHDGITLFIQVKNSADTPVRKMTTADGDFWKTLKLWVDGYKHYTAADKNLYFEKHLFVIATNMSVENHFYDEVRKFQSQLASLDELRNWLNGFSSDNAEVQGSVNTLKSLTDDELRQFALNIKIEHYNDLTQEMYNTSLTFSRNNPANGDVLMELLGKLSEDKKKEIKATGSFLMTKEKLITKYGDTIQKLNIKPVLNVTEYDPEHWTRPIKIDETNMLRQLWDIGELEKDKPSDKTYQYLYQNLYYRTNIERFRSMDLMDDLQQENLEQTAKRKWLKKFNRHETRARHASEDVKNGEAVECFHDTMDETFLEYDDNFCGGCYLKLSDDNPPQIGWHIDWEARYGE